MVHRAPHVGSRVDPRHDEIEWRPKRTEAREHHAQCRWPGNRPGLIDALDRAAVHLGLDEVQRTQRCASTRELAVGGSHHHLTVLTHRSGQYVQANGVDAVVVGEKNSHGIILLHPG